MKEREEIRETIKARNNKRLTVVSCSWAIARITPDPEDDPVEEDPLGLQSEEALDRQKWSWALPRSGRSSDEEDSSDSQLWEETFEASPKWLRDAKNRGTEEEENLLDWISEIDDKED